jgi:hypothetical protein
VAQNAVTLPQFVNLDAASRKELEFWRMTLQAGLRDRGVDFSGLFSAETGNISADFTIYTDWVTGIYCHCPIFWALVVVS